MQSASPQHLTRVRIRLLGSLDVAGDSVESPHLSKAVRRFICLIAASGPEGVSRDQLAIELWGDPPPESWKSALRNRIAAVRKAIGHDALVNNNDRFFFADFVAIDSWDLINQAISGHDEGDNDADDRLSLILLEGDTLAGVTETPLVQRHRAQVADARAVLIQQLVARTSSPLPAHALQALRSYQRLHPLERIVTQEVIRAHVVAGESAYVTKIVSEVVRQANEQSVDVEWVDKLELLSTTETPRRRKTDSENEPDTDAGGVLVRERARLFNEAAAANEWNLALEIAMEGLPAANRTDGDPERLRLFESIPLEKLEGGRKFSLSSTISTHLMAVEREAEAREWASLARALATTDEEHLIAYLTSSAVGDTNDESIPIPLPSAFEDSHNEAVNMRSLQVAVMSHLERSPFNESMPLLARFGELVERSADPYRRWHMLMLQAMRSFLDGEFDDAEQQARRAHQYAQLFGIADADSVLCGQLSNARWVHDGFEARTTHLADSPPESDGPLTGALRSLRLFSPDDSADTDTYVRSFNFSSRSFFTVPRLILVANDIADRSLRRRVFERLMKRTGTSAIFGSGALHLGPVDRVLARLAETGDDRVACCRAALQCADTQQTRLWQVVCRRGVADATGEEMWRTQASEIATTPALAKMVAEYVSFP